MTRLTSLSQFALLLTRRLTLQLAQDGGRSVHLSITATCPIRLRRGLHAPVRVRSGIIDGAVGHFTERGPAFRRFCSAPFLQVFHAQARRGGLTPTLLTVVLSVAVAVTALVKGA